MLANLKAALAARKIRQVDLAISLKISPSVLSEIIHGRRSAGGSLRARIAEALRADETWLFAAHTSIPAPRSLVAEPVPVMACAAAPQER